MKELSEQLSERVSQAFERVTAQREEILEAFIAKYGCGPDELIQVEQRTENGWRWWVERVLPAPKPFPMSAGDTLLPEVADLLQHLAEDRLFSRQCRLDDRSLPDDSLGKRAQAMARRLRIASATAKHATLEPPDELVNRWYEEWVALMDSGVEPGWQRTHIANQAAAWGRDQAIPEREELAQLLMELGQEAEDEADALCFGEDVDPETESHAGNLHQLADRARAAAERLSAVTRQSKETP
jgi:hypothetical protein